MVLERLVAAGLTLNAAKYVFCKPEVAYLGFLVNRDGTRPNPAKIEPIKTYPVPQNLKALRRFLGTTSWYRRFIPNYATIAEPLTNLTKKNQKYQWLDERESSDRPKQFAVALPVEKPNEQAGSLGIGVARPHVYGGTPQRRLEPRSRCSLSYVRGRARGGCGVMVHRHRGPVVSRVVRQGQRAAQ